MTWKTTLAIAALAVLAPPALAQTTMTGVLSTDTVRLICQRAAASYFDFGAEGYGCHNADLTIACRASADCIATVRDTNSYLGKRIDTYLRQHGQERVDTLTDPAVSPN